MKEFFTSKKAKTALLLVLSVLYIAAIICLFFNVGLGILLWGAALIPSLILFLYQKHQEQLAREKKAEEDAKNAEKE